MKLRRFKVIKEYPGSANLGDVFIKDFSFGTNRYISENKTGRIEQDYTIENFPEYFEEIESLDTKVESEGKIAYIEEKFTIWERKTFNTNEVTFGMFQEAVKKGCPSAFDGDYETNYDSQEEMSIEMNEGEATIEAFDYDGNMVWNNKDGWLNEKS